VGKLICKRCGYTWQPYRKIKPVRCPNPSCRTPYWNKERVWYKGGDEKNKERSIELGLNDKPADDKEVKG